MTDYGTKLRTLRDLIEDIGEEFYSDTATTCDYHTYIADRLLYNGVILPPVKVGDIVYQLDSAGEIYETEVTQVIYNTNGIAFDERAIGRAVFLTREEAEAALVKLRTEATDEQRRT